MMFGGNNRRWFKEQQYRLTYSVLAGVDEVGRGALAGPVVAAAVILPRDFDHPDLNDSKCLSPEKREKLYEIIVSSAEAWAVAQVENKEIDEIGILKASLKAMAQALSSLSLKPQLALIDGRFTTPWPGLQKAIIDGDALCPSIAAASILAKVTRDRLMEKAAQEFPHYGFENHKGYGTRQHLEALRVHGPCPLHRFSFRPVAEATRPEELRPVRRVSGRLVFTF